LPFLRSGKGGRESVSFEREGKRKILQLMKEKKRDGESLKKEKVRETCSQCREWKEGEGKRRAWTMIFERKWAIGVHPVSATRKEGVSAHEKKTNGRNPDY